MIITKNIHIVENEKWSLSDLFEAYSGDIFRYSRSILKNEDDAKDIVQDVFVKYAEKEDSFNGKCSHKTWLLIITRNLCFNRLKKYDRKNERIENERLEKLYEIDYDSLISLSEALKKLTAEHNELLYLKEYENYSYKEISEITGQSVENVKIKLFRARQRLRQILKKD